MPKWLVVGAIPLGLEHLWNFPGDFKGMVFRTSEDAEKGRLPHVGIEFIICTRFVSRLAWTRTREMAERFGIPICLQTENLKEVEQLVLQFRAEQAAAGGEKKAVGARTSARACAAVSEPATTLGPNTFVIMVKKGDVILAVPAGCLDLRMQSAKTKKG